MNTQPDMRAAFLLIEAEWDRSDWDPIGVSGIEEARDEYYGYLPEVFHLVIEGAPSPRIAADLLSVATDRMGLDSALHDHMAVAEKIHSLRWRSD